MAASLTNEQKREWAKILYLKENLTQQEIADKVGVTRITVNKWINNNHWEVLKASISVTREEQLSNLYIQISEINNTISQREAGQRFASAKEADTINKLAAAIEKMEKDTGVADIINVSKKMLSWIRKTDISKAAELSYLFEAFVKENLK